MSLSDHPSMVETYYERLGVAEDASTAEIKRAYREKLKRTHPDVSDDEDASDRTKRLIEAKEVLVDDEERTRYDRLGHEQYVAGANTTSGGQSDPAGDSQSSDTASETTDRRRSASHSSGSGRASTTSASGTTGSSTRSSTTGRSGWTDAGETAWGSNTDDIGASSTTRDDQRAPRDSWRDTEQKERVSSSSPDNRNTAWRAWDTEGAYSVNSNTGFQGTAIPTGQSLILLCATFLFYPLMLAAALFPAFPLAVNVTLGVCVLLVVAYLQSMPTVGIIVFGTWAVLVPLVFASLGIGLVTPVGLAALAGTVFPLGLSVLTRTVIRP